MAEMLTYAGYAAAAMSVVGAVQSSDAANQAAEENRARLAAAAIQEDASAQHEAESRRRKADLMISRALAVGAASGSGTSGIEGILKGIAAEGEKSAGYARYEGAEKAKGMVYQGDLDVSSTKAKGDATVLGAVGNAGMSMYSMYGSAWKQGKVA